MHTILRSAARAAHTVTVSPALPARVAVSVEAVAATLTKRFVACVTDNVVDWVQVSEAPDDPAGDNDAEGPVTAETLVEKVLTLL